MSSKYTNELKSLIEGGSIPPFVYSYPTRSSYRKLDSKITIKNIWHDDEQNSPNNDLNLYLHIPFCSYKCGYCNLYSIVCKDKKKL